MTCEKSELYTPKQWKCANLNSLILAKKEGQSDLKHHNIAFGVTALFLIGTVILCIVEIVKVSDCLFSIKDISGVHSKDTQVEDTSVEHGTYIVFLFLKLAFLLIQVCVLFNYFT